MSTLEAERKEFLKTVTCCGRFWVLVLQTWAKTSSIPAQTLCRLSGDRKLCLEAAGLPPACWDAVCEQPQSTFSR